MEAGDDPVHGDLRREHWIVPVRGVTRADPDGVVQAIAHRDGTVILHLTYGSSRTGIRLEVGRAAQLCTGIQEAAMAALQLSGQLGEDQPAPPPPTQQDRSVSERPLLPRQAPPRRHSPRQRRRSPQLHNDAVSDASRALGLRIQRIRHHRNKSLRVVSGLAGMSTSTLHRIEHGQRDLNLADIVALAHALEIAPETLIRPAMVAAGNGHSGAAENAAQTRKPPAACAG